MGQTDRKPWSIAETRSLIALREEMKAKFDAMKRNRSLWVELSDKLKNHFGHTRTPAQCAVRWKNILAAYKESRQGIKNNEPPALPRICAFYKEVEAVVGDQPIPITALTPSGETIRLDDASSVSHAAAAAAAHAAASASAGTSTVPPVPFSTPTTPARRSRSGIDHAAVMSSLTELRSIVESHGQTLQRIERMLSKEVQLGRRADGGYDDTVLLDEGSGAVVEMHEAVAAEAAAQAAAQAAVAAAATEAAVAENAVANAQAQAVADVAAAQAAAVAEATAGAVVGESHEVEVGHDTEDPSQGPATKKARIEGRVDGRFATVS